VKQCSKPHRDWLDALLASPNDEGGYADTPQPLHD
jgi:hypothetical protein